MNNSSVYGSPIFEGDNLESIHDSITCCSNEHESIEELGTGISKKLHVNDEEDQDDEENDDLSEEELLAQMGYAKSEPGSRLEDEEEVDDGEKSNHVSKNRHGERKDDQTLELAEHKPLTASSSPSQVLNLVSALKGSRCRERRMPAQDQLRVSWAPDVYDPIPTSPSQFALNNSSEIRDSEHKPKGKKKSGGKGLQEIEEGRYFGEKGSSRGNRSKDNDNVKAGKGSRKDKDKVKRKGRDKKYAYSNYDED